MKDTFAKLKTKSQKELVKLLAEKKDALQTFKLGNTKSKTKNVKAGRVLRKEIAQILTIIDSATK